MVGHENRRKVVVTGASGFLGSHIVPHLLREGYDVKAVLREGPQKRELPVSVKNGAILTGDVFNQNSSWWQEVCEDSFAVIHSAWFVVPGEYADATQNLKCLTSSLSLAEGALAAGVSKFVGIGTCAEYNLSIGPATTKTPLQPESLYAASKVALFHVLSNLFRAESINLCGHEFFICTGKGSTRSDFFPTYTSGLARGCQRTFPTAPK